MRFEEQQRGAWHAHIAVKRVLSHYLHKGALVKSYDLLRAVWRAVVGKGNVDVSRARRHSQRNISKLASYLTKYLAKTFEDGVLGTATGPVARLSQSLSSCVALSLMPVRLQLS